MPSTFKVNQQGSMGLQHQAGTAVFTSGGVIGGTRQYTNTKALGLSFTFRGDFKINGRPMMLTIDPVDSERSHLATGLRIWDGGIVLAKYLERLVPTLLQASNGGQLRALELGCGTGVAGISFAFMGQQVVLSDIGDCQKSITQANIDQNQDTLAAVGGKASFEFLDWNSLPDRQRFGHFDIIFASDVIWHETLVEPFVKALKWAFSGPGCREALLSHTVRDPESVALFQQLCPAAGFVIEKKVSSEAFLGNDGHPRVEVYHVRKAS